ncbi:MAG TPA: hypothetical protein PKO15_01645 [Fibrobacteria bacterium]|nr:hypothetical protein [Fibrobacteria bacterium]HOX49863.1 hypothetical protein [Fibrobacteria bacterium]
MVVVERLSGAEEFFREGEGYFKAVLGGAKRPAVFTEELVHDLLCMALEKYCMAILAGLGELPLNHTFADLAWALKHCVPVSARLESALLLLDERSDLCSLEIRKRCIPTREELARLVEVGRRFQSAAREVVLEGERFPLALEAEFVTA